MAYVSKAERERKEVLDILHCKALEGNVGAIKLYLDLNQVHKGEDEGIWPALETEFRRIAAEDGSDFDFNL